MFEKCTNEQLYQFAEEIHKSFCPIGSELRNLITKEYGQDNHIIHIMELASSQLLMELAKRLIKKEK